MGNRNRKKVLEQSVVIRTMRICLVLNIMITAILLLQGCVRNIIPGLGTSKPGYYHVVKHDENLSEIAKTHQIDVRELSALNNLDDDKTTVKKGTVLFIPGFGPPLGSASDDSKRVLWTDKERKAPFKNINTADDQKKSAGTIRADEEKKEPEVRILEGSLVDKTSELSGEAPKEAPKEASKEVPKATPKDMQPVAAKGKSTEPETADRGQKVAKAEVRNIEKKQPERKQPEQKDKKPSEPAIHVSPEKGAGKRFIWPVRGTVISTYGPQKNGMFYNGISIDVPKETSVVAAAEGYVIFSATLKDYGETVIIRHDAQYATVYTHLTKRLVKTDQKVKQGDPIALVSPSQGSSPFAFEIRHKNKAQDPIQLLSP